MPLDVMPNQAYMSNLIQVPDILMWILDQIGPAQVKLTSFSISEEFLRRLFLIKKSNVIKSLDLVLDFKATNKTLLLWPFIAQTVEHCYLAANHSKVMLVCNEQWSVSVVMSQNLTRGNRFEAGFISTDKKVFRQLYSQVDYIITTQSVPFNDVFTRAINAN